MDGVLAAASIVFFAVFGYDTLTTAAEEVEASRSATCRWRCCRRWRCPWRMYLAISLVLTGMVPYNGCMDPAETAGQCHADDPGQRCAGECGVRGARPALGQRHHRRRGGVRHRQRGVRLHARCGAYLVRAGARWLAAALVRQAAPAATARRIARPCCWACSPRWRPDCCRSASWPKLVNIGTLSAFIVICASVLILRIRKPNLERRFRTPFLYLLAPLGVAVLVVPDHRLAVDQPGPFPHDRRPGHGDHLAFRDLDGDRLRDLFRLRHSPQLAGTQGMSGVHLCCP